MLRRVRRAAKVIRDDGVRLFALRVLARSPYRQVALFESSLDREPPGVADDPSVEVRRVEAAELDLWADFRGLPEAEARRRMTIGHECYAAWRDGRIVSSAWIVRDRAWLDELDAFLALGQDEVYWYDSYTAPALRREHLATIRTAGTDDLVRRQGCRRLLATARPENPPGRRALLSAGYRQVGTLARIRLGRWHLRLQRGGRGRWRVRSHRLPRVTRGEP